MACKRCEARARELTSDVDVKREPERERWDVKRELTSVDGRRQLTEDVWLTGAPKPQGLHRQKHVRAVM